jgi:biopolymer transport protein ExbD
MQFYARKRRQPPAVIIVALIDILIVLLIFLMVTTTFKQQPALKLALPESSQAQKSGANEAPPLTVSIDAKGSLRLGTDNTPVTIERLKEKLLAAVAKAPDTKLALSADKMAPFGQIVKVMDVAKEAQLKMVSAYTKETKEAGKP